ncbi:MAG: hypothetical protein WD512_08505 [Candidatus Paceibacterota bacterium]
MSSDDTLRIRAHSNQHLLNTIRYLELDINLKPNHPDIQNKTKLLNMLHHQEHIIRQNLKKYDTSIHSRHTLYLTDEENYIINNLI